MTKLEVLIRNVFLSDLNQILEIEKASFEFDAFSGHTLKTYIENSSDLFFIAEVSGFLAGYVISTIQAQKGLVVSIAVVPEYRCRKIGKSLVDFTFDNLRSRGVQEVALHVRKTDTQSVSFWEKMGFHPIRTIPNFYSDNAEAIHMTKIISGNSRV